jgi:hypothetical protein
MAESSGAQKDDKDDDDVVFKGVRAVDKPKEDEPSVNDSELENLRKELEKTKKEKAEALIRANSAETQRNEANRQVQTETSNRFAAEETAITNAIAAATSQAESLEKEYIAAQEGGKFADAARIARQLASAQTKIDAWEGRKQQFEQFKATEAAKPKPTATADPLEASLERFKPRVREWIRHHPQYLTDNKFQAKANYLHQLAVAEGITEESDEYFNYINENIDDKPPPARDTQETNGKHIDIEPQPTKVSSSRVAAPPSRGNNTMSSTRTQSDNRLSAIEAEHAVAMFPKLTAAEAQKKYYEGKLAAKAAGKPVYEG